MTWFLWYVITGAVLFNFIAPHFHRSLDGEDDDTVLHAMIVCTLITVFLWPLVTFHIVYQDSTDG